MAVQPHRLPVARVRFEGRSVDIPLAELGLGETSVDLDVRRAVARYLEVPEFRVGHHVIDRHETGNVTIRPEAVFG